MQAINAVYPRLSDANQHIYTRLKQTLSLRLRRQILIAVCDDLHLRNTIVTHLQADLGQSTALQPSQTPSSPIVSLNLNLNEPNLWLMIAQWYAQHRGATAMGFHILGVEHLTRQSPTNQWSFLRRLRTVENYLPKLESAIVLWISSPWLCSIEQSAPEFWRCRTGVFEFSGEPTPTENCSTADPIPDSETAEDDIEEDQATVIQPTEESQIDVVAIQPKSLLQQTLAEIEQLHQDAVSPEQQRTVYCKLAEACRERLRTESLPETELNTMIEAYEQVVEVLEDEAQNPFTESERLDWLNDLGTLHWMRFRQSHALGPANPAALCDLEQSIIFYQKALVNSDPEIQISGYARLQKNLGAAYSDLATIREPVNNLRQAIAAYTEATRYFQTSRFQTSMANHQSVSPLIQQETLQYAATQNNLGTAHWNLAQQIQPVDHLKAAIIAYTEALHYCDQQRDPLQYAMIQTNLGTAYWNLAQHRPSEELLQSAIEAYQNSLQYRTPENAPVACANTHNNLGIAYWHLANHHQQAPTKVKLITQAITAYETALSLVQQLRPAQLSFDPLATHNNIGLAHYHLGTQHYPDVTQADRISHLNTALHHHLQAILKYQSLNLSQNQEINQHRDLDDSEHQCTAMSYLIRTIRACYRESGLEGQNQALSQIPSNLLPEVLRSL